MALQPEIWEADIVANLYKDNEFMRHAFNADQYVIGGRAVHIPNANTASNVARNRSVLPATVTKRTDTDVVYALDEYTSDPILIPNIDNIQLSYDKRASVMYEDQANIKQVQAEWLLYSWGGTTVNTIATTGAASAATATGATGTRKLFVKADLLKAKELFDKQSVAKDGRYALLPTEYLSQLLADKDLAVNFVQYADIANGIVGKLYGFLIMDRSSVLNFDKTTNAAKTPDAATATTDCSAALCWQTMSVERALGTTKMFSQTEHPQFYGDVYSFLVMLGGRVRRADGKGIVAIVEAWVS